VDDPLPWVAVAAAALSGFFSLNAYALRDVSRRKLEAAFAGRSRPRLRALLEHLSELQLLCGLVRSLCNLTLLVILLYLFGFEAPRPTILNIVLAIAAAAAIISIFSMAIPHAWARYAGAKVLAVTAPVLLGLRRGLWPVAVAMRAFDVPIRRLTGIPDPHPNDRDENGNARGNARETAVKAEILHVASEGQAEGAVDPEEMDMIESVIEFGDQQAGEIMTPRTDIVALPVGASPSQIRSTVNQAGHTRIPVYDGDIDNIIGLLYAKDLLRVSDPEAIDLRAIMRKPFFVPETKRLDELLKEFKARKSHMAIVLDEYGGTAGLVTVEDLIEEIVGDIADEYDQPASALMKRIDERTVEVDGRMYIDDLNDATGLDLPEEEDYDTAAGFVFSELGFIPPVGETLAAYGATFTVLAADDRKITRIRVETPARQQTAK
jgi:CBS domain containing-hemolysin-like protein